MRALLVVGKGLAGLFWLAFGVALTLWLDNPFGQLIQVLAVFLLIVRGLECWLFAEQLSGRSGSWLERLQVLLFGVFHLLALQAAAQSPEPRSVSIEDAAHA